MVTAIGRTRFRAAALVVGVAALVTACGPQIRSVDFRTGAGQPAGVVSQWGLARVDVVVPEELVVTNQPNVRYPDADIVWYGDPEGDRKAQVAALLTEAVQAGALDALTGSDPVAIELTVRKFHAMTPRARATNLQLGVHEITFDIAVRDASGAVIASEAGVNADLRAFSGDEAVRAEQIGQGQKIRIQTRVAQVIRAWLMAAQA